MKFLKSIFNITRNEGTSNGSPGGHGQFIILFLFKIKLFIEWLDPTGDDESWHFYISSYSGWIRPAVMRVHGLHTNSNFFPARQQTATKTTKFLDQHAEDHYVENVLERSLIYFYPTTKARNHAKDVVLLTRCKMLASQTHFQWRKQVLSIGGNWFLRNLSARQPSRTICPHASAFF